MLFLGVLRLRNEFNCLKNVTGASNDHSSGNIFFEAISYAFWHCFIRYICVNSRLVFMKDLLQKFESKSPEIVFHWNDPETEAEGWVVINSLRGGARWRRNTDAGWSQ